MKRLLITGAAGSLGSMARERLTHLATTLRLSDIVELGNAASNEELVLCDLADKTAVESLVRDCDGIVHFGGCRNENAWEVIRSANFDAVFNIFEAARKNGHPRIIFASSNHAIGFYPQNVQLDATSPARPDSLYGVSKVFGESLARMYYDKFGIETASIRIGSCFPEPKNHRMLSSWISYADLIRLIECVFRVPRLGCPIIYGASDNDSKWWSNDAVGYLGWQPQDNAETFREKLDAAMERPAPDSPDALYQGAGLTAQPIIEEPRSL